MGVTHLTEQQQGGRIFSFRATMANFRSLGDLNREDSDDDRDDTNDYYAGGEKRCASSRTRPRSSFCARF